jgi:hypothetical protein
MTSALEDRPQTALDLLIGPVIGPGGDGLEALVRQILSAGTAGRRGRALRGLPEATREAVVREAATVAAELLDVDLIDMLVAGWRRHHDLTAAARRSLAAPGSTELVDLAPHEITVTQHPFVTVRVDGRQVARIQLGVSVAFDISGLSAGISAGRLVALYSGQAEVTVTLTIQGTNFLTRRARLELPGVIQPGAGIRLLAAGDYPAGAGQAESTDDDHVQQLAPAWEDSIEVGPWAYRPPGTDFDDDDDDDDDEENH